MAVLGTMTSTATLLIGGYLRFLPVSVLYVSAAFPLLLGSAGALCRSFSATATGERRAAVALLLVLAAALAPSTVSYMTDGARFDYRPALTHIKSERSARHGGDLAAGASHVGRTRPREHRTAE